VVKEASEKNALILHTLATGDLRTTVLRQSRLFHVDAMDLMGPVLDRLSVFLKTSPKEEPGLYKHLAEGKPREIEAVAFAFHHDDGQGLEDLDRAELVIVGISRSMKTPMMLYLAYHGWFAANVPLIMEIAVPPELISVPPEKVFCLIVSEERLLEMRRTRAKVYGFPPSPYISPEYVRTELDFARNLCRKYHWRIIDTTGKSIEESAREIVELYMPGGQLRRNIKE
jgi:regulator of PEP synthase PpsR (kinase-PPPase family)